MEKGTFSGVSNRPLSCCSSCQTWVIKMQTTEEEDVMMLTTQQLAAFASHLCRQEKSAATQEKYLRDVRVFSEFTQGIELSKELVIRWKKHLVERGYAVRSVNSMIASVNCLLGFLDLSAFKVKSIRIQQQAYCREDQELTKAEYMRLLEASRKNEQLNLVLQTICGTGIRVSELKYFTVEAVKCGEVTVDCKSKTRTILVPGKLKNILLNYAKRHGIATGTILVGRNGKPLDRSSIWRQMKQLCKIAGVKESKVFPHNLRKLFARTFYGIEKDIAKLADILGHSSINTTRIYIMTTGTEHRRKIERLGLVL